MSGGAPGPSPVRLLAEGGAIMVSILLALAADAAWQERGERIEEAEELARVAAELRRNEELVERHLGSLVSLMARGDTLLERLDGGAGEGFVEVPLHLVVALLAAPGANFERGVTDALIASGRLSLVRDPDVREALAEYLLRRDVMDQVTEDVRAMVGSDLMPYLRAAADPTRALLEFRRVFEARPESYPWEGARGSAELPSSPEMRSLIAQKQRLLYTARVNTEFMLEQTAVTLAEVEPSS